MAKTVISCMRVNDNENGLEFFEFVVLISYVYFVDGCQGGGIGFFFFVLNANI